MVAELAALARILEGVAVGEGAGAEGGVELQQRLPRLARLLELAARRKARGQEAQIGDEAWVGGARAARPQDRVLVVAGGIACDPDSAVCEEDVAVVGREPEPDVGAAARLARLADVAEGGAAAHPGYGRAGVGGKCAVEQLDRLVVVAEQPRTDVADQRQRQRIEAV